MPFLQRDAFNGGKATLKDIMAVLEVAFNKDVGNYCQDLSRDIIRKAVQVCFSMKQQLVIYCM